jgi:hypothetical protein
MAAPGPVLSLVAEFARHEANFWRCCGGRKYVIGRPASVTGVARLKGVASGTDAGAEHSQRRIAISAELSFIYVIAAQLWLVD